MEAGLSELNARAVAPVRRSLAEQMAAVRQLVARVAQLQPAPRQERLSGVHNPWGHSCDLADAWTILDLLERPELLDAVQRLIGPDIVLWDSELFPQARLYLEFLSQADEGRYWPVEPLAGAVALARPATGAISCATLSEVGRGRLPPLAAEEPLLVARFFPSTSHFERDPRHPANWRCMEERPLVNYAARPLWLVRGQDRARNDFVSGFAPSVPRWAAPQHKEL